MKLVLAVGTATVAVIMVIAGAAQGAVNLIFGDNAAQPSEHAVQDIPNGYLRLYQAASRLCPGLDWTILAAIGKIETDHGRSTLPGVTQGENYAGAAGPMQFLSSSFAGVLARHQLPAGGASPPSRYNAHDAVHAAAFYLCDSGAQKDIRKALFAYNHSETYVNGVLGQAKRYGAATVGTGDCNKIQAPHPAAIMAINFACGQLGLPYVWGGNGAQDGGFDCSGLTKAAYAAAGITLPRTAHTQYHAGPRVPAGQPLMPGDLVFYGDPKTKIHHVGLYLGGGLMVDAPDRGQVVKVEPYRYRGDDFAGATRPANEGSVRNLVGDGAFTAHSPPLSTPWRTTR